MTANNLLSSKNPVLTVVIPCLNVEDTLGLCLSKLVRVSKNENFKLEVIVADNGSKEYSIDIASKLVLGLFMSLEEDMELRPWEESKKQMHLIF